MTAEMLGLKAKILIFRSLQLPLSFEGAETCYLFRLTYKEGGRAGGVENSKRQGKNVTQVVYGDTVSAFLILS